MKATFSQNFEKDVYLSVVRAMVSYHLNGSKSRKNCYKTTKVEKVATKAKLNTHKYNTQVREKSTSTQGLYLLGQTSSFQAKPQSVKQGHILGLVIILDVQQVESHFQIDKSKSNTKALLKKNLKKIFLILQFNILRYFSVNRILASYIISNFTPCLVLWYYLKEVPCSVILFGILDTTNNQESQQ